MRLFLWFRAQVFLPGLLILMILPGKALYPAPLVLPGEEYRTLRTEHFRIHYPADRKDAALTIASMAEDIHRRLEPRFHSGATETHLVLIFRSDLVNAYTTVYGMDRILLYLKAPGSDEFSRYRDWIEQLLVHEYTHILTLRPYNGFWNISLRLIIGVSPNVLVANGLAEGYAVREESRDGTGRLEDPQTYEVRDVLALSDRFPSLEEAATGARRWPYGEMPYLFGGRFVSFLRERCGEDSLDGFFLSRIPAFFPSWRLSSMKCGSIDDLYAAFADAEKARSRLRLMQRLSEGVTPRQRLTFDGGFKRYLVPGGLDLFYFAQPEGRSPGIYSLDALDPTSAAHSRLYYRATSVAGFYLDEGLPVTSEQQEILQGSVLRNVLRRGGDPLYDDGGRRETPAGSGSEFVYIRRADPYSYLVRVEHGLREHVLLRLPDSAWMGQPAFQMQTTGQTRISRVVVVVRRPGSIVHSLVVCENDTCNELVSAEGVIATPSFAQDGRILFASDVDGGFDIYAADRAGEVRRLTRSGTGFTSPVLREDGLFVLGKESDGQEVFRVPIDALLNEPGQSRFSRSSGGPFQQPTSPCSIGAEGEKILAGKAELCVPLAMPGPQSYGRFGGPPAYFEWDDPAIPSPYPNPAGHEPRRGSTPYNGLFSFQPFMNGIFGGPLSYFNAGVAGYDPLSRHELQAGVGVYDMERSYDFLSYSYKRFRPDLSLSYAGMPLDRAPSEYCFMFTSSLSRNLCAGERRFSFQESTASANLDLAHRLLRNRFSLSVTRTLYRNTQSYAPALFAFDNLDLTSIRGGFDVYYSESSAKSISPERGFAISGSAEYLPPGASRGYGNRGMITSLSYERYQGAIELYLPFFFNYHVPVLRAYSSFITGRNDYVEETRLSSVLPGLNADLSPYGKAVNVYTAEYRFPVWQTRTRILPWFPSVGLRYLALAPFAATGQAREVYEQIDPAKWVNTSGIRLTAGLYALYQPLEFQIVYARGSGPAGEGQVSFGFSVGALPSSYGGPSALRLPRPACRDGSCLNR